MSEYKWEICTKYKVKSGETLESIAKANGISWKKLAKFNFGTTDPQKVQQCLAAYVGCNRHIPKQCQSAVFDDKDEPGIIYLPKNVPPLDLKAGEKRHVVTANGPNYNTTVEIETVNAVGLPLGKVNIILRSQKGLPDIELITDTFGYVKKTGVPAGIYEILLKDGRSASFWKQTQRKKIEGSKVSSRKPKAIIDTSRINSVKTLVVETEYIRKQDLIKRSQAASDSDPANKPKYYRGDDNRENSQYGDGRPGKCATDNLAILAGWMEDNDDHVNIHRLVAEILPAWLQDHCPTLSKGGYFVYLLEPENGVISVFDKTGSLEAAFGLQAGKVGALGTGAFALFEQSQDALFCDVASRLFLVPTVDEKPHYIEEFIVEDDVGRFYEVMSKHRQDRAILYILPGATRLRTITIHGGAGLEQYYGIYNAADQRIHKRNVDACKCISAEYRRYIANYIYKVKKNVDSEAALRKLGPPIAFPQMPRPVGATDAQYSELLGLMHGNDFDAWLAIAEKLNFLRNKKNSGRPFIRFKFKYELSTKKRRAEQDKQLQENVKALTNKVAMAAVIESNIDVEFVDGIRVIKPSKPVKVQFKFNDITDFKVGNVEFGIKGERSDVEDLINRITDGRPVHLFKGAYAAIKVGPCQFHVSNDGKRKFSYDYGFGAFESEIDSRKGEVVGGYTFKFEKLVDALEKKGALSPRAAAILTGLELGAYVGFTGTREEIILAIVTHAPGFFELRPINELFDPKTTWNDLTIDESSALADLGWHQSNWDNKYDLSSDWALPTKGLYDELTSVEKVAVVRLGFSSYDEYGENVKKYLDSNSHYTTIDGEEAADFDVKPGTNKTP